jgi:hypothetical protein
MKRPSIFNLMSHRNEGNNRNYPSGRICENLSHSMHQIKDYYANPIRSPEILLKIRTG